MGERTKVNTYHGSCDAHEIDTIGNLSLKQLLCIQILLTKNLHPFLQARSCFFPKIDMKACFIMKKHIFNSNEKTTHHPIHIATSLFQKKKSLHHYLQNLILFAKETTITTTTTYIMPICQTKLILV